MSHRRKLTEAFQSLKYTQSENRDPAVPASTSCDPLWRFFRNVLDKTPDEQCICDACRARRADQQIYLELYETLLDAVPSPSKLRALTTLPLPANTLELAQVLRDVLGELRHERRVEMEDLRDELVEANDMCARVLGEVRATVGELKAAVLTRRLASPSQGAETAERNEDGGVGGDEHGCWIGGGRDGVTTGKEETSKEEGEGHYGSSKEKNYGAAADENLEGDSGIGLDEDDFENLSGLFGVLKLGQ